MGGAMSADNNELVEKLVRGQYLRTPEIHRVFRAVDRGDYVTPDEKNQAYKDLAWKYDLLHLSSPCIYCDVMEGLKLKPGLSFLNLGSGTGYLSTMAGLLLGIRGINHGIELHSDVVQYAYERLNSFLNNSPAIDEFDFCEPKFVVGNCLNLSVADRQYDRVYCGAACPEEYENYMKNLIKVGGILVMPVENNLFRYKRISDSQWQTKKIHSVSFSTLITPSVNQSQTITMPETAPQTLQVLCRSVIRRVLRDAVGRENPSVLEVLTKSDTTEVKKRNTPNQKPRVKTVCLAIDDDDDDSDSDDFNRIHNLDPESGSREVNALLRLVLSMGGSRDCSLPDYVSDDDLSFSASTDDLDTSANDGESSQSSQSSDYKQMESDMHVEPNAEAETNSENKETADTSNESDSAMKATSSKSSDESNNGDSSSNAKGSDTKAYKFDSGIDSLYRDFDESDDESVNLNKTDADDSIDVWRQRKRHFTEENQELSSEVCDSSDSDSDGRVVTQSKLKKKSSPAPHPYDINRKTFSKLLQDKIKLLPLPSLLLMYVNMNRQFSV